MSFNNIPSHISKTTCKLLNGMTPVNFARLGCQEKTSKGGAPLPLGHENNLYDKTRGTDCQKGTSKTQHICRANEFSAPLSPYQPQSLERKLVLGVF